MFPLATLLTLNIKIYQGLQKLRKPYPSPRPTAKSLNSPQEIPKERASLIRTPIFRQKSEIRQNVSSNMSMTEDEARKFPYSVLRAGSCTSELQLKVNCRNKFGLAYQANC